MEPSRSTTNRVETNVLERQPEMTKRTLVRFEIDDYIEKFAGTLIANKDPKTYKEAMLIKERN